MSSLAMGTARMSRERTADCLVSALNPHVSTVPTMPREPVPGATG